jgi:hypothetical protein
MAEFNVTPDRITDPVPATATHVVVAAWQCDPCEVQGRSFPDVDVQCWNCGGPVTVTAPPSKVPCAAGGGDATVLRLRSRVDAGAA